MLDIEPKSLVFRDIRLNESYTSNLLLTNPLSTHVSVTLRPSAPGRYVIAPNQINIQPGKSVVVTVRLHINNFPAYEKGVRGQEDHIQVSSSFFEQKISSMIFLQKRSGSSSLLASTAASFQNRSVIGQDSSSVVGPSSTSAIQQPPPPPEEDSHKHRKFIKTMKNNASFAAAANAEKRSTEHIIAELNSAVKLRDMTIEKLNATIVKLEQNHPNFHDIIRDRVELERISFEEKSQKVLEILNKKDYKLENLQKQLDEQLKREQSLEDELQQLRDRHSQLFAQDLHKQQGGGGSNNRYVEELQHRLSALEEENTALRRSLERGDEALKEEKLKRTVAVAKHEEGTAGGEEGSPAVTGHVKVLQDRLATQEKELLGCREENVDQMEQIEVLISEVSKLRREADESRERYDHQQQFMNNMSAAANTEAEDKVEQLQQQVQALEEDLKGCQERYRDIYNYNQMLELQLEDSARETQEQSAALLANSTFPRDLDTTGMNANSLLVLYKQRASRAEEQLQQLQDLYAESQATERQSAGGLADMEARNQSLIQKEFAFQKKEEALRSQEIRLEEKAKTLQHLMSTSGVEAGGSNKENVLQGGDCQLPVSTSSGNSPLKNPATPHRVPDLGKNPVHETFTSPVLEDANAWWSYVWHEMRKGSQNHQLCGGGTPSSKRTKKKGAMEESFDSMEDADVYVHDAGDPLGIWADVVLEDIISSETVEAGKEEGKEGAQETQLSRKRNISKQFIMRKNAQIEKLRNVVRSHAIEVTTLRQAKLLTIMQHKQAQTILNEKLEAAQREISKLQAYTRNHRGDKEIKIAEMAATIKSLAARSDLHSELAIAHQDLEAEKLVVCSLRNDIESYREMLETEKDRVATVKRQHDKMQAALSASQVAESLLSVPGLNPGALIELFSGRLMWLQAELVKARSAASSLSLSRMQQQGGSGGKPALRSHLSPLTPSSSSASSSSPHSSVELSNKQNHAAVHQLQENLSFREPEHWQKELLQKATTPDKLLSGLDTVLLARRVNEQSETIETLQQKIHDLEAALTSVTIRDSMVGLSSSVSVGEGEEHLDRFGEQARIEKHAAVRRLELCQENLKQSEDEVEKLRARVVYAESTLSDFKKKLADYGVQHCKPCISCSKRIEKHLDGSADDVSINEDDGDASIDNMENESLLVLLSPSPPVYAAEGGGRDSPKCSKCDNVRQLLQERTTQLKILMETLEALQLGDSKQSHITGAAGSGADNSALPSSSLEDIMANLDAGSMSRDDAKLEQLFHAGHNAPRQQSGGGGGGGQQWEARALVKRIIELTADASAHCSAQAMTERQLRQLESDKTQSRTVMNKLLKKMKQMEANTLLLHKKYSSTLLDLNRVEKLRVEEKNDCEVRMEELLKVVRERDNECDELRVSAEELQQQMNLADRSAFQKWFAEVVVSHPHEGVDTTNNGAGVRPGVGPSAGDNTVMVDHNETNLASREGAGESSATSVRSLVVTLLVQWRDQAGFYPRGATGPISKAEQRFLQRLTDLVMDSHDRASEAEKIALRAQQQHKIMDRKLQTVMKRLETTMLHLFHYRCRAEAAERLGVAESNLKLRTEGTLASVMRKATRRLSDDLASVTTKYLKERALNCSLEVDMKLTKSANKDLKQQLAALEAKGSVYIQAHEAALGCVDGKIRDGEKQLQAWIKTEIPRLLTGLPISEDDYGEYDVEDALNALGVNFRQHENFPGSRWTEEKGGRPGAFDHFSSPSREQSQQRYFALAQALCTSKATQNKLEITVHTLQEKNIVLRERVIELTGVISRWKEDFVASGIGSGDRNDDVEDGAGEAKDEEKRGALARATKALQEAHENEVALRSLTEQQRSQVIQLEESLVVSLAQLSHAEEREGGLRELLEVLRRGESDLKQRAAVQVSRVKQESEERHLLELRALRETYEQEKAQLTKELEEVSAALIATSTADRTEGEGKEHRDIVRGRESREGKGEDRESKDYRDDEDYHNSSGDNSGARSSNDSSPSPDPTLRTPLREVATDVSPLTKSSVGSGDTSGSGFGSRHSDDRHYRHSSREQHPQHQSSVNKHTSEVEKKNLIDFTDHDKGMHELLKYIKKGYKGNSIYSDKKRQKDGDDSEDDLLLSPSSLHEDGEKKLSGADNREDTEDSFISDVSLPSHRPKQDRYQDREKHPSPSSSKMPLTSSSHHSDEQHQHQHDEDEEYDTHYQQHHERGYDATVDVSHDDLSYAVHELSRRLGIEQNRARQARGQVVELEQLLETQREAFQRHLDLERDIAANMNPNITLSTSSSSSSTPLSGQDRRYQHQQRQRQYEQQQVNENHHHVSMSSDNSSTPPSSTVSTPFGSLAPGRFPLEEGQGDSFNGSFSTFSSTPHPLSSFPLQQQQQQSLPQHQEQQSLQQQKQQQQQEHLPPLSPPSPPPNPVVKEVAAEDPTLWPPLTSMSAQLQSVLVAALDHINTAAASSSGEGAATVSQSELGGVGAIRLTRSASTSARGGDSNQESQSPTQTQRSNTYTYMKGALYKNRLLSLLHEASILSERLHRASQHPVIEEKYLLRTTATTSDTTASARESSLQSSFTDEQQQTLFRSPSKSSTSSVPAPLSNAPGAASSTADQELSGLLQRVSTLEDLFSGEGSTGEHVPEKHLYLLRELRGRVLFLEEVLQAESVQRQSEWGREKEELLRQAEESRVEAAAMNSDGVEMIRKRYEHALKDAQEALVDQTASFTKQIELLEIELSRCKSAQQASSSFSALSSAPHAASDMEGHLHMQKLLDSAASDADGYRKQLKDVHEKHANEVQHLRDHFEKYRKAQEQIVSSLEQQVKQAEQQSRIDRVMHAASTHPDGGKLGGSEVFSVGGDSHSQDQDTLTDIFGHESVTPGEGEAMLKEIAYRLRCKQAELKAVLRALSVAGAATSAEEEKVLESKDKSASEVLLEARVEAAGKEVQHLYRLLERERKHNVNVNKAVSFSESTHDHQQDLEDSREESIAATSQTSSKVKISSSSKKSSSSSKTDMLLSTRKAFANEIDDLKAKKHQLEEAAIAQKAEVNKLRHVISDLKEQITTLREDNSRKSKLLSAIRASKSSDDNALEQWRHEVSESEDKLKRATRSIASKEGAIRDYKAKVEALESQLKAKAKQLAEVGAVDTIGESAKSWSMSELRNRYKASELEKARMKSRVTASKERIVELEKQVKTLEANATKRKALEDKTEAMKLALARKDAILKNHKEQLEAVRVELLAMQEVTASRQADGDKHLRTMQRQLEVAEGRQQELLREKDSLRDRYEAEVRKLNEESVYLRGLLSETALELESRFQSVPSSSMSAFRGGVRAGSETESGGGGRDRQQRVMQEQEDEEENDVRRSQDSHHSHSRRYERHHHHQHRMMEEDGRVSAHKVKSSTDLNQTSMTRSRDGDRTSHSVTASVSRSVKDTDRRNTVLSELSDIMEELSGEGGQAHGYVTRQEQGSGVKAEHQHARQQQSGRFGSNTSIRSSRITNNRFGATNSNSHRSTANRTTAGVYMMSSSEDSSADEGRRHTSHHRSPNRVGGRVAGRREAELSLTSRLLQETEAEVTDDDDERGEGGRNHQHQHQRQVQREQKQGLVRSPDSDQHSSGSSVLSVENRLKGLIQAALRED